MTDILTPSQTSGPLFGFSLIRDGIERSVTAAATEESALCIEGQILDGTGIPLVWEAMVEFWNDDQFARSRTKENGIFRVYVTKPLPKRLPHGRTLSPHFNVTIFGRGLNKHLVTRIYFPEETAANEQDPVLGLVDAQARSMLIAQPGNRPRSYRFNMVLQGEQETPFFRLG